MGRCEGSVFFGVLTSFTFVARINEKFMIALKMQISVIRVANADNEFMYEILPSSAFATRMDEQSDCIA